MHTREDFDKALKADFKAVLAMPDGPFKHDAEDSLRRYAAFREWAYTHGMNPDTGSDEVTARAFEQFMDERFPVRRPANEPMFIAWARKRKLDICTSEGYTAALSKWEAMETSRYGEAA